MKRYTFRMEQVLRVRRLQEDAARAGVAVARSAERAAEEALTASHDHYRALANAVQPAPAAAFLARRDRGAFRATGLAVAQGQRSAAADATAGAVDGWRASHQRVEALERLDERRRDEYAVELRRFEDAVADEIAVSRARAGA